jgi:elongation factor G
MGELHLEVAADRLAREFGVQSRLGQPQVAYREAIGRISEGSDTVERQVGGRGWFAHVRLRLEPRDAARGNCFDRGGVRGLSEEFLGAIEDGAMDALSRGVVAGFPVSEVRVVLVAAESRTLDSTGGAFRLAAARAAAAALAGAAPHLLEPVMHLDVILPSEILGPVLGNLAPRRARVVMTEDRGAFQAVRAEVPLSAMFGYATEVRSLTQGRATFTMQFLKYAPVPQNIVKSLTSH